MQVLSESQFLNTPDNNESVSFFVTHEFILISYAIKILSTFQQLNRVVERSRALDYVSKAVGRGLEFNFRHIFHFEFFAPFPFLTSRRSPHE